MHTERLQIICIEGGVGEFVNFVTIKMIGMSEKIKFL